jgi:hypothetical protein
VSSKTRHFDVAVSGSGSVETASKQQRLTSGFRFGHFNPFGSASNADFAVSGSGKIEATRMSLNHCDAAISGSGNM